jgi:hypothetical protein
MPRVLRTVGLACVAGMGGLAAVAVHAQPLKNWFDDPYFAVRQGLAACAVPRGPYGTEEDMRRETHSRAERGTSCWLAGRCSKPNAYLYDRDLAAAVRARFDASPAWRHASLWVTVQRRIVYVEGCVPAGTRDGALQALLKDLPELDLLVVNVSRGRTASPPYRAMPAEAASAVR